MVLRRCRYLLNNEESARDAMQEVFVRVLRRRRELRDTAPSSLLYRVATNVCLNVIRSNSRKPPGEPYPSLERLAATDDPERTALDRHFLAQLFKSERESTWVMAVLHWVDGMTLQETAEVMGLSVSGVRKRLRRLRARGLALRDPVEEA